MLEKGLLTDYINLRQRRSIRRDGDKGSPSLEAEQLSRISVKRKMPISRTSGQGGDVGLKVVFACTSQPL
jgi:hypothetical protein